MQIFLLGCVIPKRDTSSHTSFVPSNRVSQAAKVSASHLNICRKPSGQSVRPSVYVGRHRLTPRQTPLPPSQTLHHLTLAADWLTFCSVACVSDSVSSFLNRGDEMMRDSWLVELCQAEQMGGDWALPAETNYQHFFSKTNILQPKSHPTVTAASSALYSFSLVQPFYFALLCLPDDVVITYL